MSSASDGESFVYQSQAGGQTAQAKVTIVDIDNSGSVDGSFLDEILIDNNSGRTLNGYSGDDILIGGPGSDEFEARDGEARGGEGNDRIEARDGEPDTINCGPGEDVAVVDEEEEGVFDCEEVVLP